MTNTLQINPLMQPMSKTKQTKLLLDKVKIIVTTMLISIALIVAISKLITITASTTHKQPIHYTIYTVAPNDTLWTIAESCNADNKRDVREIIEDIRTKNKCNSDLSIGQKIKIPVYNN